MSDLLSATKHWPSPRTRGLPLQVVPGRSWSGIEPGDLPELFGRLFLNTEAQAIKLKISDDERGLLSVSVEATSCPAVPYSTLSGETLLPFLNFIGPIPVELWIHEEYWYWKAELDDESLEFLVDRFMDSQ